MKRFFTIVTAGVVITIGLFAPLVAQAGSAPANSPLVLETSPLPINLVIEPGKSATTDIRVKQAGVGTARLKVGLMKFRAYGEEGKPELVDRQPGDDYFDWVKFDKKTFDAPSNVWQTVRVTVNLPKSAAFGYYYAVTFSREGDDVLRGNNTNSIAGATAVLMLVEAKSPNAKRTLELAKFSAEHRIYEFLPAKLNVTLSNTGNVHGVPQGNVFIMKGKKQVAVLPLNGSGGNILPGSKRLFPVLWNDGFPVYKQVVADGKVKLDDKGQQVESLSWDWTQANKFRMGKYTAHLFAIYDDGSHDVPIESKLTFWVIPWRILLAVVIVIALIGFGVYSAVRGTVKGASRGMKRVRRRR